LKRPAACNASTCQLDVGFVKSSDAGATWTTATQLAGPMSLSWLPSTSQGPMVGDYMSTSWSNGLARPAVEVALAPSGGVFNQATYVPSAGLLDSATTVATTSADRVPLPGVASDHVPPTAPVKSH
jgi:hypothetical protein